MANDLKAENGVVYFDSGASLQSGRATQCRVANEAKESLLPLVLGAGDLDEDGNLTLAGRTNNYGELRALSLALEVARGLGAKEIRGDSELVIDYWSKGICKSKDADTLELSKEVTAARSAFEAGGGTVKWISGDLNPADLGYHKA